MLADMSNPDDLPWKGERDRERVAALKEKARTPEGSARTFHGLHVELLAGMLTYLDTLQYADEVDYSFLYQTIKKAAKDGKIDLNVPYDWELDNEEESKTTTQTSTSNPNNKRTTKPKFPLKSALLPPPP